MISRNALVFAASAAALAVLSGLAEASSADKLPTDKKPTDWTQDDMEPYVIDVMANTAALGLGLAVLYGIFECVCCCYCCCAPSPSQTLKKKNPRLDHLADLNDKWSKKLPGSKWFFIGSTAFVVAFAACTLGTWGYWNDYKVAMLDTYDGVQTLTTDFAGFLCSDERSATCEEDTIGDFLEDAKELAGDTFDDVSEYLAGLEELTDGLDAAIQAADDSIQLLNDMDDTIDRINGNISAANTVLAELQSSVPSSLSGQLPDEIDTVDDGGAIDDAIDLILDSQTTATDIQDDLDQYYTDTIEDLRLRIDGDENTGADDDREELFNTIDDILDAIMDTRDDILDVSDDISDNRDQVEWGFDMVVMGVSLFFALPCIIMLFTTIISKLCCKVAPVYTSMGFTYFFQIFFCFAAGLTLLFAILWHDVCVVHDDVIEVSIGNYTTKIHDTEVALYGTVMDVLKCGHNKNSDVDQNLAAILGFEQEFNVTEYVDPVIEEMYEVRDYVQNQTVIVEESIELIDEVLVVFVDFTANMESYSTNVTTAIAEVDAMLASLPSEDMGGDRDDLTEQGKVEANYPFVFANYQPLIDAVNTELGQMTKVPYPFNETLTFQTIQFLTPDVMNEVGGDWLDSDDSGECDAATANCADYGSTSFDNVLGAVDNAYTGGTDPLNQIIAENNDVLDELEELRQYLVNIDTDIHVLEAQEEALVESTELITTSLDSMVDDINAAADGLDPLIEQVYFIIDFVATAPTYLGCKWIGNFYVNTIKGSFCTDSVDALYNASAPMVSVPTLMMLFFCFAAIYLPVLRDARLRKNQKALGDAFDIENNAMAPPPPSLELVDAVPEQKTNEYEMSTVKGGDESRPSSTRKSKKMDFN